MTKIFYSRYEDAKKQSQAGRALLDFVLREYYNIVGYNLSVSETGKPYVEGHKVHFNLSHSYGAVVLAVSDEPVGVDVEPMRDIRTQVIKRFLGEEIATCEGRLRAWLEYESYGKMTGEGVAWKKPAAPHVCHHFEIKLSGKSYYICVCTPSEREVLTPCFVPVP